MGTCLTPATDQLTRGLIDVGTRRQLARRGGNCEK